MMQLGWDMGRILSYLFKSLKRLRFSRYYYTNCVTEIRNSNIRSLVMCSFITTFLSIGFLAASFIFSDKFNIYEKIFSWLYTLISCFFCFSSAYLLGKHKKLTLLFVYAYMLFLSASSIITGVFLCKDRNAVFFFIAQTTFPVIFLDTPLRMAGLSLVSAIVFDILAYFFKTPDRYMIDIMNSVIFLITGMLLSIFTANIKLNDFIFQKAIKTERDTDGLTGLLNKSSMMREIRKSMTNDPKNGILVMLDVDDFKRINDSYGHVVGDFVISGIARCLNSSFRNSDIIGRFGGDEFVIFMPFTHDVVIAQSRVKKVLSLMAETIELPNENDKVTGSFGIAVCSEFGDTYDDLFRKADYALYQAKSGGKNQFSVYESMI
ncbi:MAG: GGDEF domain-containing protein [Treponema porcinum]|uniref:GGDEF domain-containing protein n=1 Tax=Treponema porcinum TaxID=261392 RepID=UPI00235529B9|nr:GGDEF domain-containing protein [Treponema porcinum]MCI6180158.1 GGDEF domain-containing protein [Treponema porcinum]MCI7534536.1 GGDEF domain-containing protein [Treponema porcinum]MCI7546162.1 GGDEF domain-containing protein [Treponema porcinum]MDD6898849.1 GGDEF domain-containing protein [Treponema porcinum]MDY4190568.1 GGDEF domain-containing protein [Treponema porcinum]